MLRYCWLVLFMGIVPLLLGLPWVDVIRPKHKYAFSYSTGFFMVLTLYELVGVPISLNHGKLSTIVLLYSVLLMNACGISIWVMWKKRMIHGMNTIKMVEKTKSFHWTEWIYMVAFFVILGLQLYRGLTYDLSYMSYDDATYTPLSTDALLEHGLLTVDPHTGEGTVLITKLALSMWHLFPAYISALSDFSVTTIEHTVQYIQLIILAYATYWFVAGEVIKRRDNQLIFMVVIALFYWFGYHSHYSLTFRLLGPNYQGKAVLAVSLTPLVLTVLIKELEKEYSRTTGIYLLLLSVAGLSLTLWGAGTIVVIVLVPLLLSIFRKDRVWKHLLYAPWSLLMPALGFGYYLINNMAV